MTPQDQIALLLTEDPDVLNEGLLGILKSVMKAIKRGSKRINIEPTEENIRDLTRQVQSFLGKMRDDLGPDRIGEAKELARRIKREFKTWNIATLISSAGFLTSAAAQPFIVNILKSQGNTGAIVLTGLGMAIYSTVVAGVGLSAMSAREASARADELSDMVQLTDLPSSEYVLD